jgi:hypothetical protein
MKKELNPYKNILYVLSLIKSTMIICESQNISLDLREFNGKNIFLEAKSIIEKLGREKVITLSASSIMIDENIDGDIFNCYNFEVNIERLKDYYRETKERAKEYELGEMTWSESGTLHFDEKTSFLAIGDIKLKIPVGTIEYYVCKHVFKHDGEGNAPENDILEDWDSMDTQSRARSVRDAVGRINKKAQGKFGIERILSFRHGLVSVRTAEIN